MTLYSCKTNGGQNNNAVRISGENPVMLQTLSIRYNNKADIYCMNSRLRTATPGSSRSYIEFSCSFSVSVPIVQITTSKQSYFAETVGNEKYVHVDLQNARLALSSTSYLWSRPASPGLHRAR